MNTLRYARKVTKGDLLYHDYLLIDKIEKKVIYIKEEETGKQSLLNYKKKTASSFTKIIEKYKEKGFELIEKDGADDRIRQADVIQGIDLHVDVSTYADYCKVRPERGSYFSFERIQRAVDYTSMMRFPSSSFVTGASSLLLLLKNSSLILLPHRIRSSML